jgi:alanine dehydrogenase
MKNILILILFLATLLGAGVIIYQKHKTIEGLEDKVAIIDKDLQALEVSADSLQTQLLIAYDLIKNLDESNIKLRLTLRDERKKSAARVQLVRDATVEQHLELFSAYTD